MVDNTRSEEALSALMDSEALELETRRVLKEIAEDPGLRDTWHRYQLASASMKRELPYRMVDLSQSISAAIELEAAHKPGLKQWLQPLGKIAIAASVAVIAVIGVQQIQTGSPQGAGQPAVASAQTDSGVAQFQMPAGFELPPIAARNVSVGSQIEPMAKPTLMVSKAQVSELENEEAIRTYLNQMMERHTRNAANTSSSQGILPLARLPQVSEEP